MNELPIVIVSGAAGAMGSETARELLRAGLGVVGIDINPAVEMLHKSENAAPYLGIVGDHEDVMAMQEAVAQATGMGQIRHLLTFAGLALPEEISHDDERGLIHPELFRASVNRNLLGHVNLVWAVQPHLFSASGDKSITLCSSINALQTWGEPAYSSAKAGLIGLVKSLAGPFGRRGVRVNALVPGTIDTPAVREEYHYDPERFERMLRTIPLGRIGEPKDVAGTALALVRDLRYLHGAILPLDGGQSVDRGG